VGIRDSKPGYPKLEIHPVLAAALLKRGNQKKDRCSGSLSMTAISGCHQSAVKDLFVVRAMRQDDDD
jgi:hypothetical protein